jgi:DNA (cytosine-5)-methyltransferase 1
MKYGSVCSGIEAASVAWHPLGWEPQWFSEIESFPSEVLKQRFPDIPNLGDMTKLTLNPTFNEKSIDLLVGGTPCQSFSVAGLRGGLADPRGNLMLTFLGLADAKKPKWIVWENVPGVLSSNGGKDFGTFLGALAELGYGFAYRVLDAQHFGVAQRRRRVFVVGHLGDWRPAAAVLFESESLQRNPKQSRAKREETPTDAQGCVRATSPDGRETIGTLRQRDYKGIGNDDLESGRGLAVEVKQVAQPQYFESHPNDSRVTGPHDVGNTVSARYGTGGGNTPIVSQPIPIHDQATRFQGKRGDKQDGKGNGLGIGNEGDVMNTLTKADKHAVAQPIAVDAYNQTINEKTTQTIGSSASDVNHYGAVLQPTIIDRAAFNQGQNAQYEPRIEEGQTMSSLVAKGPHAVQHTMAIRRLTPKECERLQGFPDDWTKIHYHKNGKSKECPDGPRYKACGNSMAVPVMRWIGERIEKIEKMLV